MFRQTVAKVDLLPGVAAAAGLPDRGGRDQPGGAHHQLPPPPLLGPGRRQGQTSLQAT